MTRLDPQALRRIRIIAEDDSLLVIDKPAGLPVHGGAGQTRDLLQILLEAYGTVIDLHLVHRLDAATSGVIALAKSKAVAAALQKRWDESEKTYLAVVFGAITARFEVNSPLLDEDGVAKPARSNMTPMLALGALDPPATLVSVRIHTGRMHQIRRHLASVGHPILLDTQHGDFRANRAFARALKAAGARPPKNGHLLHSAELLLPDLTQDRPQRFLAPMPEAWRAILRVAGGGVDVPAHMPGG